MRPNMNLSTDELRTGDIVFATDRKAFRVEEILRTTEKRIKLRFTVFYLEAEGWEEGTNNATYAHNFKTVHRVYREGGAVNPYANFGRLADYLSAGLSEEADAMILPMVREGARFTAILSLAVKVSKGKTWRARAADPGFVAAWVLP